MATTQRPPLNVGFLERKRGLGTTLTLLVLVGVGVAVGTGLGVLLTAMVKLALGSVDLGGA